MRISSQTQQLIISDYRIRRLTILELANKYGFSQSTIKNVVSPMTTVTTSAVIHRVAAPAPIVRVREEVKIDTPIMNVRQVLEEALAKTQEALTKVQDALKLLG